MLVIHLQEREQPVANPNHARLSAFSTPDPDQSGVEIDILLHQGASFGASEARVREERHDSYVRDPCLIVVRSFLCQRLDDGVDLLGLEEDSFRLGLVLERNPGNCFGFLA
ncbi:hypothetical protein D3C86_1917280 [compost metagenome]